MMFPVGATGRSPLLLLENDSSPCGCIRTPACRRYEVTVVNPRVSEVTVLDRKRLRLRFDNGEQGIYDCSGLLGFGVFQELQDETYFRQARVLDGTVVWPHEQDICPDTLYVESRKA